DSSHPGVRSSGHAAARAALARCAGAGDKAFHRALLISLCQQYLLQSCKAGLAPTPPGRGCDARISRHLHGFATRQAGLALDWRHSVQEVIWKRKTTSPVPSAPVDRKSTRLNSSHVKISYAVFCLKKKKPNTALRTNPH